MQSNSKEKRILQFRLRQIQKRALEKGLQVRVLKRFNYICFVENKRSESLYLTLIITGGTIILLLLISFGIQYALSCRCLLPLNYLVWEVARPLADCSYCANVTKPIILWNVTRHSFKPYAYSSKPIIVKNSVTHWSAIKYFSYYMFKRLYEATSGSYESLEGCQFLNFKTDLFSLKEVFSMSNARVRNEPGEKPWYVGWGNCHSEILQKVRKYYSIPDFLPEDAEYPATENIFFGYEIGAVMHLDYIPRLMWQGQVRGRKNWIIAPVPECEHECQRIEYYVEPGDVVLLDTRLWYHSTSIPKGQFSITVQSEYG
ncbi:uncharacterized protein LOC121738661 [Aricia agestis]|uniref:uncharacterized protein LOC121738661 n=1 Tax=Aricia agestis TaxID=91739 RepID=UPI001C2070A0|nr:uncharacterized protein LOC121738661 [Aricia agestis]